MRAVKRYLIKCIAHADKTKFKSWKEVELGDTYAGWSECPPVRYSDFIIRFHHKYDVHNTVRLGNVRDVFHNFDFNPKSLAPPPFKLHPKMSLDTNWREQLGTGDYLVQTEDALLIVREVAQWQ